jgi:hypothetical protein
VLLAVATGALTSCGGEDSAGEDSNPATWVVAPNERVTGGTTEFTAIVTRTGCSSGVQGEPRSPDVEYAESEVRVTFRISPRIDSGTCEGTPGVAYEVELDEPLGDRSLVDGECRPGSTAWATAFCLDEGVRYGSN